MGTHHGRHRHRVVGVAAATRGVSSSPVEEKAEGPVVEGADENSIFYWVAWIGPGCWPCDLARPGAELGARNQVDWATYLVLGLLVY
jgi:hypothetical protein